MIFGLPAVLQSRYLKASDTAGINRNQFSVNLTLSTPATHVAGPNDDTLYGLTWLDLTDGPQVIEVPATHGRYYSIQLIDMWSNSFAYIGLRATGDRAGAYAITPPGWSGKAPSRVKQIKSPTKRLLALVRTFVKDPKDLKAAQKIHTSYTTGPLSRYPNGRIKSRIVPDAAALNVFASIDLTGSNISLYEETNSLINEYPPLPADARYAKTFRGPSASTSGTSSSRARHSQPCFRRRSNRRSAGVLADLPTLQTQTDGWSVNLHVPNITHDPLRAPR